MLWGTPGGLRGVTLNRSTFTRLTLYTQDGTIEAASPTGQTALAAWSSTKTLQGRAAGNLRIVLRGRVPSGAAKGKPWPEVVTDGDWFTLDVIRGKTEHHVATGRIDTVTVSIDPRQGASAVTVTLNCRDAAWPLDDLPIYFNPRDPLYQNNLNGKDMLALLDGVGGAPRTFLQNAINGFYGPEGLMGGYIKLPRGLAPGEGRWIDLIDVDKAVQSNLRGVLYQPAMLTPEDNRAVWEFLNAYRNPALNELFVDTTRSTSDPRTYYINFRERPFENTTDGRGSPWYSLPTHRVPVYTCGTIHLTRGAGRVNHIMLTGEIVSLASRDPFALYDPVYHPQSVERHSLRRLEETTRYYQDIDGALSFEAQALEWLGLIVSWNAMNAEHWNGQIVIQELRPEIRVGHKIALTHGPPGYYEVFPKDGGDPEKAMTFYVEAVQHRWSGGSTPMASTELTVSRGFPEDQRDSRLLEVVGEYESTAMKPAGTSNGRTIDPLQDDATDPDIDRAYA